MTGRVVTNEDVKKYMPMVEFWLKKGIIKNWNEASMSRAQDEISLGNSGYTMSDMRQHLLTEVVVALRNFKPDMNTKESTFVYGHLFKRVGGLMKGLVKEKRGYGVWTSNLETVLHEIDAD